ncbi:MAG TPA: DNA topoisomerase III, partial [Deltaproteobacteria bacterium]|nr:DNA topoisomerase III [Deltaproteobacteria bacterium]
LVQPVTYQPEWKVWALNRLPMLPEAFQVQVREGATDQWKVLRKLLQDRATKEVVNACDAGREGELIFRYVYQMAESKLPVTRLWVASLTDSAIRSAWSNRRPGQEFNMLADAARSRAEADWLVGLNATRALTCLARKGGGQNLMSVGRVQTPTLAMIVGRDLEIEGFQPQAFWTVSAPLSAEPEPGVVAEWRGVFFQPGGAGGPAEKKGTAEVRMASAEVAEAVATALSGQTGTVATSERKPKRERPPLLHDLSSLQQLANKRFGFSAKRTLELAQSLYERHKLLTYPRTDARKITPEEVSLLPGILNTLRQVPPYREHTQMLLDSAGLRPGKRVVDAAEVGDHHAILPTDRNPLRAGLSADEKRIYDLVSRRLLAALSPDARFEITTLIVVYELTPEQVLPEPITSPLRLRAKGRVCVEPGWQAIEPPRKKNERDLPPIPEGTLAEIGKAKADEKQTRPPSRHNDASILQSMESAGKLLDDRELARALRGAGLGTPATRAAILQTLLNRGFIERKARELWSTERGRALIACVPVDELKSPELTGQWESRLSRMSDGKEARSAFMAAVREHTARIVAAIAAAEPPAAAAVGSPEPEPKLGDCPVCDRPVRERKSVYGCDSGRDCTFVVFKKVAKRPISKRTVRLLLKGQRTPLLKNFKSKKGKSFSAALTLDEDGKVSMVFPPRTPTGLACPRCATGRLVEGRTAWGCARWREGCDYRIAFMVDGKRRSPQDAAAEIWAAAGRERSD